MEIQSFLKNDICTVMLIGKFTIYTVADIYKDISKNKSLVNVNIHFNLSGVSEFDSAAAQLLLYFFREFGGIDKCSLISFSECVEFVIQELCLQNKLGLKEL